MSLTMKFERVRDALINLLGAAQGTEWETIGYAQRDQSAEKINNKRNIQVYYNSGDFPKFSSGSGPYQHQMGFHVIFSTAEKAKGDLTALDNATDEAEYLAALETFSRSEFETDRNMDDFISKVYQVIMAPQNRNLGLDVSLYGRIGSRWVASVRKEQVKRVGSLCTMRAMLTITGIIPEDIAGIQVGTEMIKPDIDGDYQIKGNVKQSGFEQQGEPAP